MNKSPSITQNLRLPAVSLPVTAGRSRGTSVFLFRGVASLHRRIHLAALFLCSADDSLLEEELTDGHVILDFGARRRVRLLIENN